MNQLTSRRDRRAGVQQFRVPVASDDLGRRNRGQLERLTDVGLHLGWDVRVRADGTAQLHDRDRVASGGQATEVAVDL